MYKIEGYNFGYTDSPVKCHNALSVMEIGDLYLQTGSGNYFWSQKEIEVRPVLRQLPYSDVDCSTLFRNFQYLNDGKSLESGISVVSTGDLGFFSFCNMVCSSLPVSAQVDVSLIKEVSLSFIGDLPFGYEDSDLPKELRKRVMELVVYCYVYSVYYRGNLLGYIFAEEDTEIPKFMYPKGCELFRERTPSLKESVNLIGYCSKSSCKFVNQPLRYGLLELSKNI